MRVPSPRLRPLETRDRQGGRLTRSCVLLSLAVQAGAIVSARAADDSQQTRPKAPDVSTKPKPLASKTQSAETIQVQGRSVFASERATLAAIPGGTSIVDQKLVAKSRVLTDQDVLAFQPGVYAESADGADGIKISIRGSGLQNGANYFRQGIYFLFDGLPVTGPGGTGYELFEPLGLESTEVLRGANSFDVGATDLGGAIDYITKTGYDALTADARVEAGSFGYHKEQLSSGKVIGPLDYYISVTNSYRQGYQYHSRATSFGVVINVGYQINEAISTRFYYRYRQTADQYTGNLTSTQIAQDPSQAQSPYATRVYEANRIQPGTTWIGNKTTFNIDSRSKLVVGLVWQNYPIDIRSTAYDAVWGYDDIAGSAIYTRQDTIAGHASNTDIGFVSTTHLHGFQDTWTRLSYSKLYGGATYGLPVGTLLRRANYGGSDNNVHLANNTELVEHVWLTAGSSFVYSTRSTSVSIPVTDTPSFNFSSLNIAPRVGLRYELERNLQVYGNVSRTIEPPNDWEYLSGATYTSGPLTGLTAGAKKLRDETATTFEIGTSGEKWNNRFSVDYYYARVRNELLTVTTAASLATGNATYGNASPTNHQGVEAGLDTTLLDRSWGRLSLRQSYTWQQFQFDGDVNFHHNEIPGAPKQNYQMEARLDLANGLYASFGPQYASRIPIDYTNTDFTRPYTLLNSTVGYDDEKHHRQVFLSFNNMTNQHYAAVVSPTLNDKGIPGAFLVPGDGFGFFAGVDFGLK